MRTLVILATVLVLATAVNATADGPKLETEEQKTLYALGLTINRSLSPFNLSPSELELVEAGPRSGGIRGGTEPPPLARVGGKSRLVCPADLAYGDQGWPPLIKPGATLVYEVELLGISQPSARTASQSAQASSWYYCNDAKAYYPYVRECRSGWLRVAPQTAPPGQ